MWVARDKNGKLWLHLHKPYKDGDYWLNNISIYNELDSSLFPQVKWSDEKPTEVELVIKK